MGIGLVDNLSSWEDSFLKISRKRFSEIFDLHRFGKRDRRLFIDFLLTMITVPQLRSSAKQCLMHPFLIE